MRRPGDRLRTFAARWCSPDTMTRVIDPLIADLQLEHREAAHAGRRWKARLVRAVAWIAFIKVVAICLSRDGMSSRETWATDGRVLGRVLAWSSAVMIVVIALLELPYVSAYAPALHELTPLRFAYLVPQGISLALPIGATLGVVLGLGGRAISSRVRVFCLALAVLASAAAFVNLGWVTPAANQAFRSLESGRLVEPGIGELSLGQLVGEIERVNRDPAFQPFGSLLALSFAFHNRIALSLSPLVFVLFAFSMLSVSAMRRWMLVAAACVAFFSYYMFLFGTRAVVFERAAPAYAGAWLPNVVLCLVAATLTIVTRRRSRGRRTAVS